MFTKSALFVIYILFNQFSSSFQQNNYTVAAANKYIGENKSKVNQTYRLDYHFMPEIGWINDPNGFIFYKDEYHLFYQFNPYDTDSNYKVHWGHAKSKDLVQWEHLPVALAPDQSYDIDGVFSGSAIEKDGKLYLMYTGYVATGSNRGQVQCIAVSEDGITFTKSPQNPVINASSLPENAQPLEFRDPKVFKRNDVYYVVLASETKSKTGQILLYTSPDLIVWTFKSILLEGTPAQGIMWECPDLFELDGKDVLLISPIEMPRLGNDYHNYDSVIEFVGTVNWVTGEMTYENTKEIDHGMDFYAIQTLLDKNNRRIAIAWMSMWKRYYPTHALKHNWVGAMTMPRQLRLKGPALTQTPANFTPIFTKTIEYNNISFQNEIKEFAGVSGRAGLLDVIIKLQPQALFSIELFKNGDEKTHVTYDIANNLLELNRRYSGILLTGAENPQVFSRKVYVPLLSNNTLRLQIFLDKSSIEIFANEGVETMTALVYPKTYETSVGITFGVQGTGVIENLKFSCNSGYLFLPFIHITFLLTIFVTLVNY